MTTNEPTKTEVCPKCSGKKTVEYISGYEKYGGGFSPTDGGMRPTWSSKKCPYCKGLGTISSKKFLQLRKQACAELKDHFLHKNQKESSVLKDKLSQLEKQLDDLPAKIKIIKSSLLDLKNQEFLPDDKITQKKMEVIVQDTER